MEEMQARHRKELKDLQGRITQKKKSATKKTRKGINDECERLQREMLEKHAAEISAFNGDAEPPTDELDNVELANDAGNSEDPAEDNKISNPSTPPTSTSVTQNATQAAPTQVPQKKPNRQKARLARRAAEQEAEAARAAEEAANQTDHRGNERKNMDAAFSRLRLKEQEIRPDGHCLYAAVAAQLGDNGIPLRTSLSTTEESSNATPEPNTGGYRIVRDVTASFVTSHADDFAPFIEEPLPSYVHKIRDTAEWGGQLELQAMARAYGVHINVVQGDGRIEKFEPQDGDKMEEDKTIWLAYYRHTYGLGEHYNALAKASGE
ncbi:hypothetical protein AJ79_02518 [Helicocarpus griseus UAMH5409]|uniref:OTU domain-containing protein n=1 Tax=Helicocarpus griseus UAMH5409 TaxID=1447875 RepID=A0A2B7Y3D1_9EURO|nr:hypothetical protein AJ79_02518 [Helicocarpus griseus UAMH5409]